MLQWKNYQMFEKGTTGIYAKINNQKKGVKNYSVLAKV
jgi:hypothetical protein